MPDGGDSDKAIVCVSKDRQIDEALVFLRANRTICSAESPMLKHHNSSAIVAVSDLARARGFYSDTLGLELDESGGGKEGVLTYRTGATRLVVYASAEAGHNRANAVV